jgi:Flp pilus assembly protein TadG
MRWLRRDDGVVLVLVGVLLVVLLGMAGLAIDMGALYVERRELRNGADAAALAIAEDCAYHPGSCTLDALATAQDYANWNSQDGVSGVDPGDVTLDITARPATVRVVTHAVEAATNKLGVRTPLMGLFGFDRVEVAAAATAVWGYPGSGAGLALTIGTSEFHTAIHTAGGYGPEHPVSLRFTDEDAPGFFGWLATADEHYCRTRMLTVGGQAVADPGFIPSGGCKDDPPLLEDYWIPIYSEVARQEGTTRYTVAGFASFRVEGYSFPDSWGTLGDACAPPSVACIKGYFNAYTLSTGDPSGQYYYGVAIVKLTE